MDNLFTYLFKASVWLTCFGLTYLLFLRNERYFLINRIFLIVGILASFLAPLHTVYYNVVMPALTPTVGAEPIMMRGVVDQSFSYKDVLPFLFYGGVAVMALRLLVQIIRMVLIISRQDIVIVDNLKVIYTDMFNAPFTFFSYVFINPSIKKTAIREVLNHEAEHVGQYHFIDLILAELLRITLWFNPVAWLYGSFIRQNHEFLADRKAVAKSRGAGVYKAVLLNTILGGDVVTLGNHFNYSLNKKRFQMMTNKPTSKRSFLKPLLVLPMAAIVMYSFAKPVYQYQIEEVADKPAETIEVPTQNENVTAVNTNNENQTIQNNKPKDSYIYILNGKEISEEELSKIVKETIDEIKVFMGDKAVELYGERARNGVMVLILKDPSKPQYLTESGKSGEISKINIEDVDDSEVFYKVEQMPVYPGGDDALRKHIVENLKYPIEAIKDSIQGRVYISFVVSKSGDVEDVKVARGVNQYLDAEAVRVVKAMPKWEPGTIKGKPVKVSFTIPVQYKLQ